LSLDYITDVVILSNTFEVTGKDILNRNQGETILSQGGNAHQQTVGKVTAATAVTLTDRKQEWQDFTDRVSTDWQYAVHPTNYSIAIVDGTGTGQWRTITGNNDTTLTIDKPWDVIPLQDSKYVITQWSACHMLIKDNILKDNNRGIWFYSGSEDVVITGNQLINSEGIYIRSDQRLANKRYNLNWNTLIADNLVEDTNGKRGAFIAVYMTQVMSDKLFGTGVLGMEIRRNTVSAFSPNVKTSFVPGEGYFNFVYDGDAKSSSRDAKTAGILGTIFEGNKAIQTDHAFRTGTGVHGTVIVKTQTEKVPALLKDVYNEQVKTGGAFIYTDSIQVKQISKPDKLR
jgi:hypothetical protein